MLQSVQRLGLLLASPYDNPQENWETVLAQQRNPNTAIDAEGMGRDQTRPTADVLKGASQGARSNCKEEQYGSSHGCELKSWTVLGAAPPR
jgi:hypothetical protein